MQGRLSLRERLVVLIVVAMLPLFALLAWLASAESRERIGVAQSQLLFAASLLAANQDRAVDAAEQLLGAIAGMPQLMASERGACQSYFEKLRERYPMYSNIGLLALDGRPICHAAGALGDASGADRDYFREAVAQRRFVMGEPIQGRLSGRRAIPFALPVFEGADVKGVAFATLDLDHASAALHRVELPTAARVLVADRHGRVLIERPVRADRKVPRALAHPELVEASRTRASGVGEAVDSSGEARVYAFAPSRLVGEEGFIVRVGMARAAAVAGGGGQLRQALLVLGLAMLAALAVTWWIGGRVIVKPAKQILGIVRRLEQGNLDARVPLTPGAQRGEFARIGAAFNLMAQSLQMRQHDLEAELGRSRSAYEVLDLVLNSMQEALVAVTSAGRFLMYNQAAARLFPLDGPAALPQQWPELFGFYHPDGARPYTVDELPLVRSARGEAPGQALVIVRNPQVPEGRLLQCSWQPIRGEGGVQGGLVVFTDVTELERLQAEQAEQFTQLRETQRKLVEAQVAGRIGNWESELPGGTLWWSEQVFGLLGLDAGAFVVTQENFEQLIHPDDRALHAAARAAAIEHAGLMDVEYRVIRPDGEVLWMHDIAATRRGPDGHAAWIGGVIQDISRRKRAEGDLLLLHKAVARLNDIVIISEYNPLEALDPRIVFANEAFERLLGHTSEQAAGRTPRELGLYGPGTDEGALARMREAIARGEAARGELVHYARDGRELWLELDVVPMTEKADHAYLISVLRDVTKRKETERALMRSERELQELNAGLEARIAERTAELGRQEQLYRTLAEQAPEVVWNTDSTGTRLTFLNRAWYDLVGGTPEDWLGRSGLAAIHPDDREKVAANWLKSQQSLRTFTGVRRVLSRDGTYHTMSYKGTPVLDERGNVAFWVGIDADVTELKAIERALRNSNQELEAFSYSVSHDLRAPLGAIGGFSKALALKLEGQQAGDERVRHYLARIQAGVEKMEQLIDALLSLAKVARAPLDYGPVDLGAIARETLESLQMQQPERGLEASVQDGLVAHGDWRLLRVMLENLLGNAWKFTSGREAARIEVGRVPGSNVFFVRDNGVGFDMAYAGKLFGAFQRLHTEAEFPGTGIGLATVQRIVARHQGRAWAESRPGEETTFFFTLADTPPPAWLAGADVS